MNYERCNLCNIPLFAADKTLWCKIRNCPKTHQRHPDETQIKDLKIGEKDVRKVD